MFSGQGREGAVWVCIELDEDEVPDFDAASGSLVDESTFGVAERGEVDVEFGAWSAGTGVAHHPEVVFLVSVDDVDVGVEVSGAEQSCPDFPSFLITFGGIIFGSVGLVDSCVEAISGEAPPFHDEFPRPLDGFFFEVIAEGPVPEHFEERVVVGVETDVFEVVVFSTGADALLGIGCARVGAWDGVGACGCVGQCLAQKDGDELVHPRVGEEQVGGIWEEAGGGDDGVAFFSEEIEERLPDLRRREHGKDGAGETSSR